MIMNQPAASSKSEIAVGGGDGVRMESAVREKHEHTKGLSYLGPKLKKEQNSMGMVYGMITNARTIQQESKWVMAGHWADMLCVRIY